MTKRLWLPGVIRKELARGNDPDIIPVGAIFHVAVSEADSLFGDFEHRADGIESTGYIRRDGTIEQYRPVTTRCDAQGDGNSFGSPRSGFTSWETQGMAEGTWTAAQVTAILEIVLWHHEQWGVPLRQAPTWNRGGFGYHSLFDQWNHNHHSCPGPDRIKQWREVIEPRIRKFGAPTPGAAPTRVEQARAHYAAADRLLSEAAAEGRTGAVQDARDAVRAALAAHPLPSR